MKTQLTLIFGITLSCAIVTAHAQTYQWKDSQGRTVISDTAPPGSTKATRMGGKMPTQSAEPIPEKAADSAKTTAEKDMEFKKRQQEAREKTEKEAKEQVAAADRRENCERARRNLAALESSQPMAMADENGQRKIMDNTQREQEMERARRVLAETCK